MTRLLIPVQTEPLEEGGYLAVCEAIQGCHAEGETVAEALDNLEDIARILLELRREGGLPLPEGLKPLEPGSTIESQLVVTVPE